MKEIEPKGGCASLVPILDPPMTLLSHMEKREDQTVTLTRIVSTVQWLIQETFSMSEGYILLPENSGKFSQRNNLNFCQGIFTARNEVGARLYFHRRL